MLSGPLLKTTVIEETAIQSPCAVLYYTIPQVRVDLQLFHPLDVRTFAKQSLSCCPRMQESTLPERVSSALVVGFSLVSLLVKGGECGELVIPSLPPLV